ncbi:MAG: hypothetical protein KAW56_07105 [Candidatus Marinimicrobia bacterium]|nr:hypothetical protein [Candidatus Neomarinimicrobiota bacterium]
MKAKIILHIEGDKEAIQKYYADLINEPIILNGQIYRDTNDYRTGNFNEIKAVVSRTEIVAVLEFNKPMTMGDRIEKSESMAKVIFHGFPK